MTGAQSLLAEFQNMRNSVRINMGMFPKSYTFHPLLAKTKTGMHETDYQTVTGITKTRNNRNKIMTRHPNLQNMSIGQNIFIQSSRQHSPSSQE